ncbi:MAG: outer membrane protein assembly factor BamA [Bacteroidia bacterium]|nr:MAG: outer membrane protein assembly factor BamA [Bacteroidia bacterium]
MLRLIPRFFLPVLLVLSAPVFAQQVLTGEQIVIDPMNPREYQIGGITVSGTQFLEPSVVVMASRLSTGQRITIPGEDISGAITRLWANGLFKHISIGITSIQDDVVFLDIQLVERPRLTRYEFKGIRRSEADDLRDKLNLVRNDVVTENLLFRAENAIESYYMGKGYLTPTIEIRQMEDTARVNSMILEFEIDRGNRTRIREVNIYGNEVLSERQIKRIMKNTRERSLRFLFSSSKLVDDKFEEDKRNLIARYNELGKRDAAIIRDSIYFVDDDRIEIDLHIYEGPTYFFGNIDWVGNTVYPEEVLNEVLNIRPGDVYNQAKLEKNLFMNMDEGDVSSLYMDVGYLFFQLDPVEVAIVNDSIDIEIRIWEGEQARINRVSVSGNTRTNDHVIMREIRTRPGQLFSRSAIIRSQREIIQLGFFNQETIDVRPIPNPADNTVDLEYIVEETSSDQIELSGGWGANRIIGTVGISFNNFSTRNMFNREAWRPLPTGDGQRLSLRAQTYGRGYLSYSLSFTEPWMGGRRPNALSLSFYQTTHRRNLTRDHPNYGYYSILGSSVGLTKRLTFPDDYFFLQQSITYQHYDIFNSPIRFIFDNGQSNNLSYRAVFGRNSKDGLLFPRRGSEVSLSLQLTAPYSLFRDKDFTDATPQEKYRWLEYHKWHFRGNWYTPIVGDLIVTARVRFGFLGFYNSDIGYPPFERFYLGGDGLSGWEIDGREIIALRGYTNYALTPRNAQGEFVGATSYNKYTMELRYPVSLNPMATIYLLAFMEGGNSYSSIQSFNPFSFKRSAGVGARVFLPMFGLLGIDWGYGFDDVPGLPGAGGGQFHFSIGQTID